MPEKVRLVETPGAGKCVTCKQDIPEEYCEMNTRALDGPNSPWRMLRPKYLGEYAACPWWEPEEEKP